MPMPGTMQAPPKETAADIDAVRACIETETDMRKLASKLIECVKKEQETCIDLLLEAGASPYIKPYSDGKAILFQERVPRTALDHALFRGYESLAKRLIEIKPEEEPTLEELSKHIEMAAFSGDIDTLRFALETFGDGASLAHAFAYAINQGFGSGALLLYLNGAMEHALAWYGLAHKFRAFMLNYINMSSRPQFDTGDDFYSFIFAMPGIDALIKEEGCTPATDAMRQDALRILADAGFLTLDTYRELAHRAIIFDECALLAFLDEISGQTFTEVFSDQTQEQLVAWIRPRMSRDKVEIIASMLPPGFSFPFDPRYLTSPADVSAVLPHVTAATCEHPDALVEYCVKMGLNDELAMCIDWGGVTEDNVDALIKEGQKRFQTNAVAQLMDYKRKHFEHSGMKAIMDAASSL